MPARKNVHKVKRKRLVSEWRSAYKWLSVQIMAVIVGAQTAMAAMPQLHEYINDRLWHGIMGVLAVAAILGRLVNQTRQK